MGEVMEVGMAASDVMLTPMPSLNLKPSHTFTTDIIPPTTTLLAKDQLMPKPNLRANHTYSMGIIHIMLDTTILARDQLMLSQNHIGEDMVDTVDMVDITGVRTTKDNETDLS